MLMSPHYSQQMQDSIIKFVYKTLLPKHTYRIKRFETGVPNFALYTMRLCLNEVHFYGINPMGCPFSWIISR